MICNQDKLKMKKTVYIIAAVLFASCTINQGINFSEINENVLASCSEITMQEVMNDIETIKSCSAVLDCFDEWMKNADENAVREFHETRQINGYYPYDEMTSNVKHFTHGILLNLKNKYEKASMTSVFNVPEDVVKVINEKVNLEKDRCYTLWMKLYKEY